MEIKIYFTGTETKRLGDFKSVTVITDSGSKIFTPKNFDKFRLERNAEFIFCNSTETVHACSEGISFVECKASKF